MTVHNLLWLSCTDVLLGIGMILKSHTPIALYAMFNVSRRKPTLIIVPTQAKSFVFKASILWNTYQTLPEERDIRDFTVRISFLKNIKFKVCSWRGRQLGMRWNRIPSQTLVLLTLDPHSITTMAYFSTRDVLFIALYCSPHSAAQVQGCTQVNELWRYILTYSQLLLPSWNGNNKVLKHYCKICLCTYL